MAFHKEALDDRCWKAIKNALHRFRGPIQFEKDVRRILLAQARIVANEVEDTMRLADIRYANYPWKLTKKKIQQSLDRKFGKEPISPRTHKTISHAKKPAPSKSLVIR